jgi:hypothetical protein
MYFRINIGKNNLILKSDWHILQNFSELILESDINPNDIVIYIDNNLQNTNINNQSIAWILESPMININDYNWIEKNNNNFLYVFTHLKKLLDKGENYIYCPNSGSRIGTYNRDIHKKNKLISIIASTRNFLVGHKLRHSIINKYSYLLDIYGGNFGDNARCDDISTNGYNPIADKLTGLKNYCFSIVTENTKEDYYWTEKIVDCFVTGTVPIYWGCPSIGNFFNINGIITFDNIDDLNDILNNLTIEKYNTMLDAIKDNFEIAKKYYEPFLYIYNYLENNIL